MDAVNPYHGKYTALDLIPGPLKKEEGEKTEEEEGTM